MNKKVLLIYPGPDKIKSYRFAYSYLLKCLVYYIFKG